MGQKYLIFNAIHYHIVTGGLCALTLLSAHAHTNHSR